MKTEQIKIGSVYTAKVTDKVVPVRIDKENPRGGWDGTNLHTNRKVRIKSARKLRIRITPPEGDEPNPARTSGGSGGPVKKKLSTAERRARVNKPQAKADKPAPAAKATKATPDTGGKKLSLINAAVQVLGTAAEPMNCKQMVEQITAKKLWSSDAATPHATLYSAILRELQNKGDDARFTKVERGRFTLAKGA